MFIILLLLLNYCVRYDNNNKRKKYLQNYFFLFHVRTFESFLLLLNGHIHLKEMGLLWHVVKKQIVRGSLLTKSYKMQVFTINSAKKTFYAFNPLKTPRSKENIHKLIKYRKFAILDNWKYFFLKKLRM